MDSWRFLEARHCRVGGVECWVVRISYTGELGWEVYPCMGDMLQCYESLVSAGAEHGLGQVGSRVINTLRIEKGFIVIGNNFLINKARCASICPCVRACVPLLSQHFYMS